MSEIAYSAASAHSEWITATESIDADPEQALIHFEESDRTSEDETAREDNVAGEIVAEAEVHVAEEPRWAEGFDSISRGHLRCLNGLNPIVLTNSKTGLDDLGNEYVPAAEPISETKADSAYIAAVNWNDDVYAEKITSDEELAV